MGEDYEEDIYLGYKWYETYWYEAANQDAETGTLTPSINGTAITATQGSTDATKDIADQWYDYNVVYPYGYGLSYTDFSYELESLTLDDNDGTDLKDGGITLGGTEHPIFNSTNSEGAKTITAKVNVKNEGETAGKETVEVYVQAPYTSGGVEKPYYTLVGFAKTPEIAANDTAEVEITFNIQDFASFDYSDANGNGSNVYELDPGQYTVHVMGSSSHENITETNVTGDAYDSATFSINGGDETTPVAVVMDLDDCTGNEVEALFSGSDNDESTDDAWKDDYYSNYAGAIAGTMYTPIDVKNGTAEASTLLSRSDFDAVRPTPASEANGGKGGVISSKYGSNLDEIRAWWGSDMYMYADSNTSIDTGAVWEKTAEDIPVGWTQGRGVVVENGMYAMTLNNMAGVPMYNSDGSINAVWDAFMNQLTWDELCSICNNGYHLTFLALLFCRHYSQGFDGLELMRATSPGATKSKGRFRFEGPNFGPRFFRLLKRWLGLRRRILCGLWRRVCRERRLRL